MRQKLQQLIKNIVIDVCKSIKKSGDLYRRFRYFHEYPTVNIFYWNFKLDCV